MTDEPVEVTAEDPYRKPFRILILIICVSLLANSVAVGLTWNVAHDTNTIVTDVNFKNSPENQERQRKLLEEIILRVDCNSRKAIEDAINDISSNAPGYIQDINITTARCEATPKVP